MVSSHSGRACVRRPLVGGVGDHLLDTGLDDAQRQRLVGDEFAALEEIGVHGMHAVWHVGRKAQRCLEKARADETHAAWIVLVETGSRLQPSKRIAEIRKIGGIADEPERCQRNVIHADAAVVEFERRHDVVDGPRARQRIGDRHALKGHGTGVDPDAENPILAADGGVQPWSFEHDDDVVLADREQQLVRVR